MYPLHWKLSYSSVISLFTQQNHLQRTIERRAVERHQCDAISEQAGQRTGGPTKEGDGIQKRRRAQVSVLVCARKRLWVTIVSVRSTDVCIGVLPVAMSVFECTTGPSRSLLLKLVSFVPPPCRRSSNSYLYNNNLMTFGILIGLGPNQLLIYRVVRELFGANWEK